MSTKKESTDASRAFAASLRSGLKTFDRASLEWVAEGFAWARLLEGAALEKVVETALADHPENAEQLLNDCSTGGPFETYVVACVVRHCGLGTDFVHDGPLAKSVIVAGNATIRGTLAASDQDWIMVTGTLTVDALVTASDLIVGQSIVARDYILGVNGWEQSFWVKDRVDSPLLVTYEYMHTIGDANGAVKVLDSEESDDFEKELSEIFKADVAEEITTEMSNRGPGGVVKKLAARVANGESLLR